MARRRTMSAAMAALALALALGVALPRLPDWDALNMVDWTYAPPWLLLRGGRAALRALQQLPSRVVPPPVSMMELASIQRPGVLLALNELGVADALAGGPLPLDELARRVNASSKDMLFRTMRAAIGLGVFKAAKPTPDGRVQFANNALSSVLRSDHPNSVKAVLSITSKDTFDAWGRLASSIKDGKAPFTKVHPEGWQEYLRLSDRELALPDALSAQDRAALATLPHDFPWQRFGRVVDYGGAYGALLAAVLEQHPNLTGVLFDQPQVIERASRVWAHQHAGAVPRRRVAFVAGSFFEPATIPAPEAGVSDLYVLRNVLHHWPAEEAARILANLRAAVGNSSATLLVMDSVLEPDLQAQAALNLNTLRPSTLKQRSPW